MMANFQTSGNCVIDTMFMTVHDGFVLVRTCVQKRNCILVGIFVLRGMSGKTFDI